MAFASYDFYKDDYKGIVINSEKEYAYFAERASDELARYTKYLPNDETAQNALKKAQCGIADVLYDDFKASKNGQKISSESVSGYYSASYSVNDATAIKRKIDGIINTYLSAYICRRIKNIII